MEPFRNIDARAIKATDAYFKTNPTWKSPEECVAIRQLFARSLASIYRVDVTPAINSSNGGREVSNIRFFKNLGAALGKDKPRRWAHGLFKAARPTLYAEKVSVGR